MSDEVVGWLQKAEADFQNARILLRQRKTFLPDNICWSCQQSAEKYLKAYLVRHALPPPPRPGSTAEYMHGRRSRLGLIAEAVATLDQFGTDIRYPGVSATLVDARQSFDALKQLRAFVRAKLGLA